MVKVLTFCLERVRPHWLFVGTVESDELLKFHRVLSLHYRGKNLEGIKMML